MITKVALEMVEDGGKNVNGLKYIKGVHSWGKEDGERGGEKALIRQKG